MQRILNLPFLVILTGVGALAMLLPALHAGALGDLKVARPFFYGGIMFMLLAVMLGIATASNKPDKFARRQLSILIGAYFWLPLMAAVPLHQALRDTSFVNAWFEMVSCFTTTGLTVYEAPERLTPSLHLWRALVGWMGGFFVLLSAAAVLAPLNLGGIEVLSGRVPGRGVQGLGQITEAASQAERLSRYTFIIFPAYTGFTLLLWIWLLVVGENGLVALTHAMSTLATSGIVPGEGLSAQGSSVPAEMLLFLFMGLALTRRCLPGSQLMDRTRSLFQDHEMRMALFFLTLVPLVLFFRHWLGALATDEVMNFTAALHALWGGLFTTMSFLTTTGFESHDWQAARLWSGLGSPGLILLGLAMIGGGIGTTAGGLKLLRVYALARHGERELNRLVHPSSIAGAGEGERRLRRGGAYVSWIFFMLFAMTFAIVIAILALAGLEFEESLVLTVASVTTTGPLANMAASAPIRIAEETTTVKAVLALAMVVGRVEVLAILALLAPGVWRR